MSVRISLLFLTLLLFFFFPDNIIAQATDQDETVGNQFSIGAAFDLNSRYVWRGLAFSDGPVFQPSLWWGISPVMISIWGNYVIGNEQYRGQFNEIDYSIQTEHSLGSLGVVGNINYYTYPHQYASPATGEAELILSHSLGSFEMSLTNSLDFIEYPGAYFVSLGLGAPHYICDNEFYHEFSFGWSSAKFNEVYIGANKSSLLLINYSASSQFDCRDFVFVPLLNLSYLPAKRFHDFVDNPVLATIGISISRDVLK